MKNYDLSQYMLREGEILMFPITKEELQILYEGRSKFEDYIKLPYITALHNKKVLLNILNNVDMENDYWFMNTLWMVVHTKSKEIFGTLRYEKANNFNKIVHNITLLMDAQETYENALNLFVKFLAVNNYDNILLESDKECYEG